MPINLLLKCHSIAETESYYRDVLGFKVSMGPHETCTACKDDCTLIFTTANNVGGDPHFSGTIYCFIPNIDAYFDQIKGHTTLQWPLQKMDYGTREFAILDINGYTLAFAQSG